MQKIQNTTLRDTLAGLYYDRVSIRRVVDAIDLPPFSADGRLVEIWQAVLDLAEEQGKVDDLIAFALQDYPDNDVLKNVLVESPKTIGAPSFVDENEENEIDWKTDEGASTLEKIIGDKNNLLPISFLEEGLQKSRSVVRIRLEGGMLGSGFLTSHNLLVTNNHVIPDKKTARSARVEFNFQKDLNGLDLETDEYGCDPKEGFLSSKKHDWTVVRLSGDVNKHWGAIPVVRNNCKVHDRVVIIQHPDGGPKALGLYHNLVTSVSKSRIQYLTDTMPGSSGSPVFNNDWDLVALHHSGGWLREPGSKTKLFRNQGIAINIVCEGASSLLEE